jgi:hypothetical protein
MTYAIQTERSVLVQQKDRNGNIKLVSKPTKMFVGIVSPFRDPIIMYTRLPSETILHTEDDILMVTEILHQKGIKHKVTQIEKENNNFRTICKF